MGQQQLEKWVNLTRKSTLSIQTIVSRNVRAIDAAVVSVGSVSGGDSGSPNIIPPSMIVRGTTRAYSSDVRDLIERRLTELAHTNAAAYGCTAEVVYQRCYPPLVNHAAQTDISVRAARSLVGANAVIAEGQMLTGSEDFAVMLEARPGSFIMLGNGSSADGSIKNLHTPDYDFNDAILTLGAGYWIRLVQQEFNLSISAEI